MVTREEILKSPEYWFEEAQNELYRQVVDYKERKKITQTQLAEELGVTKGYVSQILKGEFNYTMKKLIEISLAIGKVPKIEYSPISNAIEKDAKIQDKLNAIKERTPKESKLMIDHSFMIVDRIDEIMKKKNISQYNLAKMLGEKESEINKWMSGTHNFTIKTIAKLETVLGDPILTRIKRSQNFVFGVQKANLKITT